VSSHRPEQPTLQLLAQVLLHCPASALPGSPDRVKPKTPMVGMISFPAAVKKSRRFILSVPGKEEFSFSLIFLSSVDMYNFLSSLDVLAITAGAGFPLSH
jgi:hypothetical protein